MRPRPATAIALASILLLAVGCSTRSGGAQGSASSDLRSGPPCDNGWQCLHAEAAAAGAGLLAPPDNGTEQLVADSVDAYELRPGAWEVEYSFGETSSGLGLTTVRLVRGGLRSEAPAPTDSVEEVPVQGTMGRWDATTSDLYLRYGPWTMRVAFPAATPERQGLQVVKAMVTYAAD